jgi:pyruvate/2-oxoglutarate dehydrogenase complex dihydrolipoamide acyltransferase (E2) component
MAAQLKAPILGGDGLTGEIVQWYKDDGAELESGEPVFCFEADFTAVDVEAEEAGRLHRCFAPGTRARPGNVVALVLQPGEHVPEHEEDAMAAPPAPPPAPVDEVAAPATPVMEPVLLPLRRGALKSAPAPTPGGAWDRAFGTSGHDYRGFWPLRDEDPSPGGEAAATPAEAPAAFIEEGLQAFEQPTADAAEDEGAVDLYGEFGSSVEEPEPVEAEYEAEELDPEPIVFPFARVEAFAEPAAPEIRAIESVPEALDAWPDNEPVLFVPAPPVAVRGIVRLTELRKLCDQLGREWRDSGRTPRNEDLFLRAAARAALENDAVSGFGDAAGLVTPGPGADSLAVLENAGSGSLRERVAQLAAAHEATEQPPCAFTLVTFAAFGIDEAVPVLPEGHAFAFAMGATRAGGAMEDGLPAPVMTLTMAYSPDRLTQGDAAALFARVRELIEAPYALLAD